MLYYKNGNAVYASAIPLPFLEITKEEYDEIMQSIEPTEEEIRAAKEAELKRLLLELYPQEEAAANEDTE